MNTRPADAGWLTGALIVLTGLIAALIVAAVVIRVIRVLRDRRRDRLAAAPRRALLAFVAEGGEEGAEDLLAISPRAWRATEPAAVALLGKVRGDAHGALAEVFEQRGAARQALAQLHHPDAVRRARAAETLGYLGRADAAEPIHALLDDKDPEVRVVAARALGAIGAPASAAPLLAALDRHRMPAHLVAFALSRIGAGAVPDLQTALSDDAPTVRATALNALGLIGAIGSVSAIIDLLDREPHPDVRLAAVTTLGLLGGRSAVAPLRAALDPARASGLRAAAARSLGEVGGPDAATVLGDLLADPDYHVANEAARALRRLGPPGRRRLQEIADDASPAPAAEPDGASPAPAAEPGAGCSVLSPGVPPGIAGVTAAAHARQALALLDLEENTGRRSPAPSTTHPGP
ncbi:HEAT repeat domain-containing protein [Actinoplanes sp. KI2]|uniref:HEAT repeat domain-containing protein n=1 Tax=Actinoplanes sp. KI2 TaxID=2983315 RepID=UPI0021D5980A|nr:HEAT repeat domain-containing protein [Actinoplanes sp. KI2]MCU7722863.1 HEAT repeat domain-containing protein [Actinoplanes sp. KI2]